MITKFHEFHLCQGCNVFQNQKLQYGYSAARIHAKLWEFVLTAMTVALGGCSMPRTKSVIPPTPISVISVSESVQSAALHNDVESILKKMKAVYEEVTDYQTEVEIIFFGIDGSFITEMSLYTFKKPKWIRLDFVSPHSGLIMVYPDRNGKVLMKPGGLLSFLTFHLSLDDPLLETPSGQRMDQTDLGLLITNIQHSVTDQRRGPVLISEEKDILKIQVLADDHFRKGLETRYYFLISKKLWLPVEVGKSTTTGVREERIIFRNLRTNLNVSDGLFQ